MLWLCENVDVYLIENVYFCTRKLFPMTFKWK
jgi:hypothetical protein